MQTALIITNEARIIASARKGLSMVAEGENRTMKGWLIYGAALNEGREMFSGDREFGEWIVQSQLAIAVLPDDRAAAIWAAGNPEQYQATKKANPRVRTVRGLHAKFKEEKTPKKAKPEPTADDLQTISKLSALAERGATEAERSSAQTKLDAFTSAFDGPQEDIIEKATTYASEPDHKAIEKFEMLLSMQPNKWLCKKLFQAMLSNKKFFNEIIKELNDNV